MIIGNLASGRRYDFYIQPFSPNPTLSANRGTKITYENYTTKILNKATQNKTSPINPNQKTIGKSYLQITNNSQIKNSFQIAYKDFDLELPQMALFPSLTQSHTHTHTQKHTHTHTHSLSPPS